ncbi:unnamed protein product [Euphydryas editha]|uniref:Copia protein n=1 Tax=Euphydryas editha TaxID=104508 RepID=A0AAU9UP73_EUPED|nr:unnamed protein product [Euphydryas editha]
MNIEDVKPEVFNPNTSLEKYEFSELDSENDDPDFQPETQHLESDEVSDDESQNQGPYEEMHQQTFEEVRQETSGMPSEYFKAKGIDISIGRTDANTNKWLKYDGMAMYIITSSMDLNQITLFENCETALEIISKLESIYEQKSELNKMLIHERFYQYKMSTCDSVAQHIAKVENLAQQLKESGESISDTAIIMKILGTLPHKYRSLRQAWMSLDPKTQNLNNLTARLLDEEANITYAE